MQGSWDRNAHLAAIAATACWLAAAAGFGIALDGYAQALHPLALLGASGTPRALAFNLLGLVLPGLLAAFVAVRLRRVLPLDASWPARIGARLALLSALAFAAQGLLPLDPDDLDGPASQWHAAAWMLWWIAFVPAALLLAAGLMRNRRWRVLALASAVAAGLVLLFALFAPTAVATGIPQRIAFAVWFAWLLAVGFADRPSVTQESPVKP